MRRGPKKSGLVDRKVVFSNEKEGEKRVTWEVDAAKYRRVADIAWKQKRTVKSILNEALDEIAEKYKVG